MSELIDQLIDASKTPSDTTKAAKVKRAGWPASATQQGHVAVDRTQGSIGRSAMSVREIPATKEWCCDLCQKTVVAPSRPPHWANLHLQQDAHDYQGAAVADASIKRLARDAALQEIGNG
jgi:hypothetical protein